MQDFAIYAEQKEGDSMCFYRQGTYLFVIICIDNVLNTTVLIKLSITINM